MVTPVSFLGQFEICGGDRNEEDGRIARLNHILMVFSQRLVRFCLFHHHPRWRLH